MDRQLDARRWAWSRWPLAAKIVLVGVVTAIAILSIISFTMSNSVRTLRMPRNQVSIAKVEQGAFHDLISIRANAVPRESIFIDAIDGGRVDSVLVQAGDIVEAGQPLLTLSNTNLALQVIQQESQLNQAISQLQQTEIALEQNQLSNERSLADIDYNLTRLVRASARRNELAARGLLAAEERDSLTDELAYYQRIRPIQAQSGQRQADLREQLLPDIRKQLQILRGNLAVVHNKLDGLVIRAPVAGKVTAFDLKVGENRTPGQRLAELTPDTGMKLIATVDEYYLPRVQVGQLARVTIGDRLLSLSVQRISPEVRNGQFQIDLDFNEPGTTSLVQGSSAQGHVQLGDDTAALLLPMSAFVATTGGRWCFVLAPDGRSAVRRPIEIGRRTSEQLEILNGLHAGDEVITSDYTGLDRTDRIVLTQ